MTRTAIIGAGLAGLSTAVRLAASGVRATLFDKGRGPGGRMSTRRESHYRFDHGAQYFTVRSERFRNVVDAWQLVGIVAPWHVQPVDLENGRIVPAATLPSPESPELRYVGTPGMSAILTSLASSCDVQCGTEVAEVRHQGDRWALVSTDGRDLGEYETVLAAMPPAQAARLLALAPQLAKAVLSVRMLPCWAVLAAFPGPLETDFDAAFVRSSPLSWLARNSSKPGRPPQECWVLHASPEWSLQQIEASSESARESLLETFAQIIGRALPKPDLVAAHRWRFAKTEEPLGVDSLWDAELRLGACGDWCLGSRVEDAFLSGASLADRVLHDVLDS